MATNAAGKKLLHVGVKYLGSPPLPYVLPVPLISMITISDKKTYINCIKLMVSHLEL
jgi:hypothetical protein